MSLQFTFHHNEHEIHYNIDALGKEECRVNDELLHKSNTAWMKSLIEFEFELEGEKLKIYRRLNTSTANNNKCRLTLVNEHKILDKQSQQFPTNELGLVSEQEFYRKDELSWVQEIKLPQHIFTLAFVLYLTTILVSMADSFSKYLDLPVDQNLLGVMALIIISMIVSNACFDVLRTLKQALLIKMEKDNFLSQ